MANFCSALLFIGTAAFLVLFAGARKQSYPIENTRDAGPKTDVSIFPDACASELSCEGCMHAQGCAWCNSGTPGCGSATRMEEAGKCERGALLVFQNSSVHVSPKPPKGPMRPRFTKVALRKGDSVHVEAFLNIPMDAKLKKKKKGSLLKLKIKNAGPFDLKVSANCSGKFIAKKRMLMCTDVEKGQTIRVNATVSLTDCTDGTGIVVIKAAGIRKAKTKFIIKPLCKCEHHMPKRIGKPGKKDRVKKKKDKKDKRKKDRKNKKKKDKKNKKHKKGRKGKGLKKHLIPEACKTANDQVACSGRGRCVQEACHCQRQFYGRYCECSDVNCLRSNGAICGGPDRGRCACGKCVCKPGYAGEGCQDNLSQDGCVSSNGLICNGQGLCKSGKCVCHGHYKGRTCEHCPTCLGKCAELRPCVACTVFQEGPLLPENCEQECQKLNVMIRPVDLVDGNNPNHNLCIFKDRDHCIAKYTYDPQPGPRVQTLVRVQTTRECPMRSP